jgi:hypothetical protein
LIKKLIEFMKGGKTMNRKMALHACGLMLVLSIGICATQVLGIEPAPPGDAEKIIGPSMWAVGVVDCTDNPYATLRVKKIEGCNVDTDPLTTSLPACPSSEADILYVRLNSGSVFDLPCEAIITKVKNFKSDGNLFSFDAQIQFVVPNTDTAEECSAP